MKTQVSFVKIVTIGILCFQCLTLNATSFSLDHYDQAKRAASMENKLLMLRFTASWCLPCKFMQKNVFEDYSFNNYMHERVIEVVVDIEKFAGMDLKEEFKVKSLPTIIFLNPDAIEVSRKSSSLGISDLKSWMETLVKQYNITVSSPRTKILHSTKLENKQENLESTTHTDKIQKTEIEQDIVPSDVSTTETNTVEENMDQFTSLFGAYYVQMGAYSEFENAIHKASELDEMFSQNASILEADDKNGNKLYKINLGPFDSEEEAEIFVQVLKDRNMDALVKKAEF